MENEVDDFLMHHGVKGMKWGVRKDEHGGRTSIGQRYHDIRNAKLESITLKTKSGESVTVQEARKPPLGAAIGALNSKYARMMEKSKQFHVLDANGKKVGECEMDRRSKDEMYFNWIGINPKHRGKGYASVIFDAGVKHALSEGCKQIVLEVPGNAPDARHIYDKHGFVDKGLVSPKGDMWGGLTRMEKDLTKLKHAEFDEDDAALFDAIQLHYKALAGPAYSAVIEYEGTMEHSDEDVDDFLMHFGVKGMKWGVRRDERRAARAAAKEQANSSEVTIKATPGKKLSAVGGRKLDAHEDARNVAVSKQKAKSSSTDSLSTKELQELVTRMNLEKQYASLTQGDLSYGQRFVRDAVGVVEGEQKKAMQKAGAEAAKFVIKKAVGV